MPRPRLLKRLEEALAGQLLLVCAPAGFGKTALLADWAQQARRPVAWLSLDQADNDPARFWRHAAAALDRAQPGRAEQLAPLLGPPAPASFQGLVTALINRLASQPGRLLLVLDDYHLIDASAPRRPHAPASSACSLRLPPVAASRGRFHPRHPPSDDDRGAAGSYRLAVPHGGSSHGGSLEQRPDRGRGRRLCRAARRPAPGDQAA